MIDAVKAKLASLQESRAQLIQQVTLHDGAIHTLKELIAEAEVTVTAEPPTEQAHEPEPS